MKETMRFLIVDGYSKQSRDELEAAGMSLAWDLYAKMLQRHLPAAEYAVLLPTDPGVDAPTDQEIESYAGILWTGCNLTIYDENDASVKSQLQLARKAYELGTPGFGSCWGIQMAAYAAGGKVEANPKGREMGIARKIQLTPEGRNHPMFEGKESTFIGFISHLDHITELPPGGIRLAGNDFTHVQAIAVTHKKGTFWGVQYHPEYDLHEMARLIVAREPKLIPGGFFKDHDDLMQYVEKMEALNEQPERKDLRWQLAIDNDVLSPDVRQQEFANWIKYVVLPRID
ncbi:MAG: type 1 glutamine amidotransferase [Candidatus Omnitrophota bacterium]